jgi:uncharacterized membrane protein
LRRSSAGFVSDLLQLGHIQGIATGIVSISGAGIFGRIVLSRIVAAYFA